MFDTEMPVEDAVDFLKEMEQVKRQQSAKIRELEEQLRQQEEKEKSENGDNDNQECIK